MRELFGLLNMLDEEAWPDESEFIERYGDETTTTPGQIRELQAALRPLLLRRMKEDVETLPEKEEVRAPTAHSHLCSSMPNLGWLSGFWAHHG